MTPDDENPTDDGDAVPAPEPSEGVRLIAADEVDKVADRDGVAKRRRSDQPKYGDRPPSPPDDVRPTIRFPLPDTGDAGDLERPRVAPVERQVAEGSATPVPDAPPPPAEPEDVTTVILGDAEQPVLDLGPSTGEAVLPHWTEPPTGQVPRVVVGDDPGTDADEEERWSSYAAGSTRWRDEHDTSDHGDLMADLAAESEDSAGPAPSAGALDTAPRASDEAYLNFDDVDLASGQPAQAARGARRPAPSSTKASSGPIDLSGGGAPPPPPPPPLPPRPSAPQGVADGDRRERPEPPLLRHRHARPASPRRTRVPSTLRSTPRRPVLVDLPLRPTIRTAATGPAATYPRPWSWVSSSPPSQPWPSSSARPRPWCW